MSTYDNIFSKKDGGMKKIKVVPKMRLPAQHKGKNLIEIPNKMTSKMR